MTRHLQEKTPSVVYLGGVTDLDGQGVMVSSLPCSLVLDATSVVHWHPSSTLKRLDEIMGRFQGFMDVKLGESRNYLLWPF